MRTFWPDLLRPKSTTFWYNLCPLVYKFLFLDYSSITDFLCCYLGSMNGWSMGHALQKQKPWTLSTNTSAKPWNFTTSLTLMGVWNFVDLKYKDLFTYLYYFCMQTFIYKVHGFHVLNNPIWKKRYCVFTWLFNFLFGFSVLKKNNIVPSENYYKVNWPGLCIYNVKIYYII